MGLPELFAPVLSPCGKKRKGAKSQEARRKPSMGIPCALASSRLCVKKPLWRFPDPATATERRDDAGKLAEHFCPLSFSSHVALTLRRSPN
jgi:hypothetical protein